MKTLIITGLFAAFLIWLYGHSHSTAIIAGAVGIVLILAEGNWHFRRVRQGRARL